MNWITPRSRRAEGVPRETKTRRGVARARVALGALARAGPARRADGRAARRGVVACGWRCGVRPGVGLMSASCATHRTCVLNGVYQRLTAFFNASRRTGCAPASAPLRRVLYLFCSVFCVRRCVTISAHFPPCLSQVRSVRAAARRTTTCAPPSPPPRARARDASASPRPRPRAHAHAHAHAYSNADAEDAR